ncbi:MAG: hypothetical protein K6G69_04890 [Lachnospiraceae bacterium]|nr:hypothetical protein [Lachnospiraceae bacterium]
MRITTKVIQNNTLSNINSNKVLQDKLSNQMSTQKKINRPSDDPVVAIRALRLRTNVSQVTQYYEKNVPDAKSWMQITEDALTSVSEVLTDMIVQCQKGSSEKLTSSDRQTILDDITALKDEVYATGNADYAGRCVFTGYRTDTTLKCTKAETKKYSITEQLENNSVDSIKYIDSAGISNISDVNFNTAPSSNIQEAAVKEYDVHRIKLAYNRLDDETDTIAPTIKSVDGTVDVTATIVSENDIPSPYIAITEAANADSCFLIKETGELLLGDNLYTKIMDLKDDVLTTGQNEGEIRITYERSDWLKDELRPEHYFACTDKSDADSANWIVYNPAYLTDVTREKQSIEYDVGLNQSIKVNTTADEVFTHAIGRDVDDLIAAMREEASMEEKLTQLKGLAEQYASDPVNSATLKNQVEAAEKALTYIREKRENLFEKSITKMQGHLDNVNYATTGCGTRQKKLELIENRLMSQKTSFETLQSDNENIDLTDVAIQLSGAELTYNAALMATSKILQTTLVSYL